MKLFNTLTRQKEEFVPITPGEVKMYSCGPTVYNYFHIGNARPFIMFDLLRRYFEYRGNKVTFVQNFTDIDDKVINKANEEGVTYDVIADRYIKEYFVDAEGLGIKRATVHPRATETMDAIIDIVKTLIDKGHAYVAENGDVYFRTKTFKEYGKLSHQPLEDLQAGARISVGEIKEDPMDFAVWKAAKPGEPSWKAPWGEGRPGWHIECTAMIHKHLGQTIDIHCGGQDLIFPHHENEIAQSECCTGKPYARYWMHNGYINVDNKKMSKSLGNFFTVREVAEKYGYEPIKYMMLSAHYRSPINYSLAIIEQCKAALERLYNCRDNLDFAIQNALPQTADAEADSQLMQQLEKRREQFIEAMDDDMNTANALSAIFELMREINAYSGSHADATLAYLKGAYDLFMELTGVLNIVQKHEDAGEDPDKAKIEELIAQRAAAKKNKDFAEADRIRDYLLNEMGIAIKDTRQGVQWSRV